jgi:hypothetical protein
VKYRGDEKSRQRRIREVVVEEEDEKMTKACACVCMCDEDESRSASRRGGIERWRVWKQSEKSPARHMERDSAVG